MKVNGYKIEPGADLTGVNLAYADLSKANLAHADLSGAYLIGADLTGADLTGANLTHANLSKANLTELALDWQDIPVIENIDQAILNQIDKNPDAFSMSDWHSVCGTTHCRAGWAVELAGREGKLLEERLGPSAAGALIYAASGSHPTPDWHTSDIKALADIRARSQRK